MPLIDLSLEDWKRCLSAMRNYRTHLIEEGDMEKANKATEVIEYLEDQIRKNIQ